MQVFCRKAIPKKVAKFTIRIMFRLKPVTLLSKESCTSIFRNFIKCFITFTNLLLISKYLLLISFVRLIVEEANCSLWETKMEQKLT